MFMIQWSRCIYYFLNFFLQRKQFFLRFIMTMTITFAHIIFDIALIYFFNCPILINIVCIVFKLFSILLYYNNKNRTIVKYNIVKSIFYLLFSACLVLKWIRRWLHIRITVLPTMDFLPQNELMNGGRDSNISTVIPNIPLWMCVKNGWWNRC
jgi:hypothetical protein